MNPWAKTQMAAKPAAVRFAVRAELIVLVVCLISGLALVVWRGEADADASRARALAAVQTRGDAVEQQFNQALTAAEVLGALARQGGGGISNFQAVALELLASRPGLATLELQPGGVVGDVVPRAGHERTIGFNVLKDAAHRPGAYAAIQRRVLTVTGPLPVDRGEPGIVMRVPVFPRGRDGRDYFWGFVAVSMRLPEVLARARVDELWTQGFSYAFFVPGSAQQQAVTIAARGALSLPDTVQQPIRAQNLEFRLALRPRGGWVSATKVALESVGVLIVSGLLCLLASLVGSGRLAPETSEPGQTQKDHSRLKAGATASPAEVKLAELQQRLDDTARQASETSEITQAKLKHAESTARELQTRLDATIREAQEAAQTRQVELEQARHGLAQAQQEIIELHGRLEAVASAESKTAAAGQVQPQQDQEAIADLQSRLEAAEGSAKEAAEGSKAKLNQSEKRNRELAGRLLKTETRVTELSSLLQKAQTDLQRLQNDSVAKAEASAASPVVPAPPETNETGGAVTVVPPVQPSIVSSPAIAEPVKLPKPPSARITKREKVRRDNQIDLFEQQLEAGQTVADPDANSRAPATARDSAPSIPVTAPIAAASATQELEEVALNQVAELKPALKPKPDKPAPARRLPATPPVNPAQLRKAINHIVPLLADQDPGAQDCLKDNRATFRSAFTPEAYEEFEEFVKRGDFGTALEHLKKAGKKHGISL